MLRFARGKNKNFSARRIDSLSHCLIQWNMEKSACPHMQTGTEFFKAEKTAARRALFRQNGFGAGRQSLRRMLRGKHMYHCHIRFYYIGRRREGLSALRALEPPAAFTYAFAESDFPERAQARQADVILADVRGLDAVATVQTLRSWQKPAAELIVLAEPADAAALAGTDGLLPEHADLWLVPMTDAEWRFRLQRWQRACRDRMDAWQTSQFLETAIDGSPDMVWYKDKNGLHEKVNESFCRIVGKTKQQVQGRGHAYIWDVEQDDPACIESERIVMEQRRTCVAEERVHVGNELRVLTTYKSPLYDLDGSVMGTVGIAIDATREHAYARELERKNESLENIFTSMDCGVLCHTQDGKKILSINRAALRILGYDSQEDLMRSGFLTVAPSVMDEDKPRLRKIIQSLKEVNDSATLEYRVRHADGEIVQVFGNIKLVERDGEVFFQRFLLDFTAYKQREEQQLLRARRRQIELLHALSIDYSLVCFFDLDTEKGEALRIGECPGGLLEQCFSGELSLRGSMDAYIAAGVAEEDREMLRQATAAGRLKQELAEKPTFFWNFRTECCGRLRHFQMKAVRAGVWGERHGVVLGFRSIDDELQEERERQAILEDALSRANQANRAKSTFLSNMSHDIRTPMNAIIGFTTLALSHIGRQEQVEAYLKKIMASGNHLLSLINDILDMSRIENGKLRLDERPCSLPDILHELRNIIQADVHTKQLELCMDAIDVRHENICCDRLRLNQVLLNLLGNAIKYTGAGGRVGLQVVEKPDAPEGFGSYEFHVKDTGIGMSEEFVSHIFEPFERERNSTISGIQGTGLGMAITQSIVQMMNGAITVTSRQGVGTECVVSLRFRLHAGEKVPLAFPELQGLRALVVDDDFNACDSVSCMLNQIGLRAEWTMSGKEAVLRTRQALMRGDRYSVYLIDWLLPDMNGVEVARRVQQEMGGDAPIIILSAYDWSDIEEEARQAGVIAFCSKPVFLSELHGCLHDLLHAGETPQPELVRPPAHSERILLAEDNELNREIAVAILEEEGFSVETAENGKLAVEMLCAHAPGYYQLILMDVQMPVMNGYEATRAIRALENRALASIPILAMTANAFEEDRQEALQSGMNGHIAKPIDLEKLMQTLEETLR